MQLQDVMSVLPPKEWKIIIAFQYKLQDLLSWWALLYLHKSHWLSLAMCYTIPDVHLGLCTVVDNFESDSAS